MAPIDIVKYWLRHRLTLSAARRLDRYTTYVNDPNARNPAPANAAVQVAIAQCQAGNTAAGIPVLEKTLANAGFTLPSHN